MKIGLGTAQLGLDYGIANRHGPLARDDVRSILERAAEHGIRVLDTSPAYGDAELRIGELSPAAMPFSIVTKTPPLDGEAEGRLHVERHLRESLRRLDMPAVYGLLVHGPGDLLGSQGPAIYETLCEQRAAGLVSRIGVSVYTAEQIDAILARYPIDLIQVPLSILDQRLLDNGHLRALKQAGVEVHARSVFLQGLLMLDLAELPTYFESARECLESLRSAAEREGSTMLEAAIGFVHGLREVDRLICGVDGPQQIGPMVRAARRQVDPDCFRGLGLKDPRILDPSTWPVGIR